MQESLKDSNSWNFVNIPPPFLMSKENRQAAGKEENTSTAATSHILLFQLIKPWSCPPQPALLDIMDRAEFIHTKGTSLHIGVQAGVQACASRSETQRLFDSSDLEGPFFVP